MITLNHVSFGYQGQSKQLKEINLKIKEGECVVITGSSGCGKTTLTRVMNGLIPHFYEGELTGNVAIKDQDTRQWPLWKIGQTVGSVFQDPKSQFFTSIVRDELAFGMGNYGASLNEMSRRLSGVLENRSLRDLEYRSLMQLSSGQKQSVAVAAAEMVQPDIYIMDEPSANLDMKATEQMRRMLLQLKEQGKTIVIAEHRLYYLTDVADRIVYMEDGRIIDLFTPEQLIAFSDEKLAELGLRGPVLTHGRSGRAGICKESEQRLNIRNLSVQYRRAKQPALRDVNLNVAKGEVVALIGKNGAGKTTLARTICGLIGEKCGTIAFNAQSVPRKRRRQQCWFVMQDTVYQLFTDSVWNEIMLNHPVTAETTARAELLLKQLHLWAIKDRHPASLSGGQKQRLVLGVGLMQQTDLMILDEPTSGLDGKNLCRVIDQIKDLRARGCGILIITHDHELVAGACDRVVKLRDGQIILNKKTSDLKLATLVHEMTNY
ncbi:energy-coupling factor ABC transporter ATP-binding protein [Sporolactobacillus shoreicorticis]|uniref:ABC transporter ATP-binding protein n=1 Tax=Sporolactobacillus shoreicorticis TaxID=1923877 RepID=A0ABW5S4G2_9BACL|nr:energy-coupling factor ABC transporter ATP-binding protein [Sporolactobacillus shoreicorticis]MCO7127057.1 energy-coupling factor ABC transporter ATP-binding protein [Sporolactobacillus shoreicorticis]